MATRPAALRPKEIIMKDQTLDFYQGKRILITGAAGTVGRELVRQLAAIEDSELRLMDNNESEIFSLSEEYRDINVVCFLGDVRDREKVQKLAEKIDIIIHCAAFKHVILSEYNPFDVVQTNIMGVENIIRSAIACRVANVIFTSSDKAVNPTNVMGTSKLMGERLITAGNATFVKNKTVFSSTRFGNVLGSRGSVVGVFMKQIKEGGPVTLTDKDMTRFVMTIQDAAALVLKSGPIAKGGEVFVVKMPVIRIPDLAAVMIDILAPQYGYRPEDIQIVEIGAKPGEKLYEELMSQEEVSRAMELDDMFVIIPAFKAIYKDIQYEYSNLISSIVEQSYVSANETPMDREALKKYLLDNNVLETTERFF